MLCLRCHELCYIQGNLLKTYVLTSWLSDKSAKNDGLKLGLKVRLGPGPTSAFGTFGPVEIISSSLENTSSVCLLQQ